MRICELCQVEKVEAHFRPFGRGRKKVCKACESGVTAEGAAIADELPVPIRLGPALEVPMGYGFRASVENDRLVIEQDSPERTDNITLSKLEAKQLLEWVESQVEQEQAA
jgi:hypothetical protein